MELRQLRYFIEVAESKSLSAAIKKLFIAQPALSRSIKELESEIGVDLFTRSSKGMELTRAGHSFLTHAYAIMRQTEAARRSARETQENPGGRVCLGMIASASNVLTVPIYRKVQERYPNIGLTILEGRSNELEHELEAGNNDLIIGVEHKHWDKYSEDKLIREELYLVGKVPVKVDDPEHLSFADAKKHLVVDVPRGHRMTQEVHEHFRQDLAAPVMRKYAADYHPSMKLVLAGEMYGIWPWAAVYEYVEEGLLSAQKVQDISRAISLYKPITRPNTLAMDKVVEIIKETVVQVCRDDHWRGELLISSPTPPPEGLEN